MNKIFWIQNTDTQLGKWQKEIQDISGSPSFCILPWIHMATRPNGDMRICCVANASGAEDGNYTIGLVKKENGNPANFSKDLPSQAFNNSYMTSVRRTMLKGEIPSSCKKCFQEEVKGIVSKRIWETGTWYQQGIDIKDLIKNTNENGDVPYKLQYLDLRLGHTCNLKCLMCSPHDSSQWVADHKKIYPLFNSALIKKQLSWDKENFDNFWYENPDFWKEIYDQIPNIKQIYFAGGEPLMIKQHKILLEEIINRNQSNNIELRYNSNGILIDQDIIDIWKKFKKVKFGFSLDAMGEKLHYIRYPTNWDVILKNLKLLDDTPDNIEVTIACAVQILNIKHIPDFIKWKVTQNFKKINLNKTIIGEIHSGGLISPHLVWIPTWLSLRVLPKKDKEEIVKSFNDLENWLKKNYTTDIDFWENNAYGWKRWKGILEWMNSEDHTNLLPDFQEYISRMDAIRGTNFKKTFSELSHLL